MSPLEDLLGSLTGGQTQTEAAQAGAAGVSTGENQSLSADEVKDVVGADQVREASARAGVSEDEAASGFAELLPQIVDKASPDGQLMDERSLDDALGKLQAAAAR